MTSAMEKIGNTEVSDEMAKKSEQRNNVHTKHDNDISACVADD